MLFAALALLLPADLQLDYRSRAGLSATLQSVPLAQGSFVQVYEPGWSRGYYSSNWNEQQVRPVANGLDVTFTSSDRRVDGRIEIRRTAQGFRADYTLGWTGDKPAHVEASFAHLWAPLFANGQIRVDGALQRSPSQLLPPGTDPRTRTFGPDGQRFEFDAPFAKVEATVTGAPAYVFDARGYQQDFSRDRELLWFGVTNVPTEKDKPARFSVEWRIEPKVGAGATKGEEKAGSIMDLAAAISPRESRLPVAPKPRELETRGGNAFRWPAERSWPRSAESAPALEFLRSRFDLKGYRGAGGGTFAISRRDLKLPRGGYQLVVSPTRVEIVGQDQEGIRNGMMRAATLSYAQNGELRLDPVRVRDWPAIGFRGVHMFVGKEANAFQGRMMTRLLAPMMLNEVVLQCERTDWDATPGIELGWTMSKPDLKRLFENYRRHGIRPTPLIQSFGHMGWLFANGRNLDIAFNRDVPFSVDPRKPRTRELLEEIWTEAVELLDPDILHFGLDEVDMRGWPNDPKLVTELWRLHVPWLGELAKDKGKEMMIWGDKMLAPGEAPDATHGHTKADAAARRAAVPKGAYIADWHYINNADPKIYTSLELFKKEGLKPVASTWNRPENIKGFFKAAELSGAGVLQTTWAGYESNEPNMLRESSQFVAYVLAGEYAWSGRSELARDLPYRADDLLRRLMYGGGMPLAPMPGRALSWAGQGSRAEIGNFAFRMQDPIGVFFPLSEAGAKLPREQTLKVTGLKTKRIAFALSAQARFDEMAELGQVVVRFANGSERVFPIRYGQHLRAPGDERRPMTAPVANGISAVVKDLGEQATEIVNLSLRGTNPAAGLRLHGVTTY